jgi:site-specific DNA recombinase
VPILRQDGVLTKTGRLFDKGALYKLLQHRTYLGETTHKDKIYPGEHTAILSRELWDRAHAVPQVSPRTRANQTRRQTPALLLGLIFTADGRAMTPTHTRRRGRLYRYYVSQAVLKGIPDTGGVRRLPAGEIEGAVIQQVRALLRQPEIIVGTGRRHGQKCPA